MNDKLGGAPRRGNGPLRRRPDGHPFCVMTDKSYIDLFLNGYPPASKLPPQGSYCLGRCELPQIVNTK